MFRYFRRPLVVLFLLFLIPMYFIASLRQETLIGEMHRYNEGDDIRNVRAHIIKKEIKNEKCRYTVKIKEDDDGVGLFGLRAVSGHQKPLSVLSGCRGILTSETYDLPVDAVIVCDCKYSRIGPQENEGCFDAEKYYASQGVSFVAEITNVKRIKSGFFLYDALYRGRMRIAGYYDDSLYGEESGLLSAMALGDKSTLEDDARQLFSDAGLAHLLAVSGLHISIVGMGLYRLLRKKGLSYGVSGTVALFATGCYGMMTGLSTSTFRAMLMFAIMIGGELLTEAYDVGSAAALAAIIILISSPTSLFDSGFLFSFGAVFGIVYVAEPMRCSYEIMRKNRFGPDYAPPRMSAVELLLSSLIFGTGLQLFVLPIISVSYHSFSPYVIVLNILLLPFMALLIGWGLLVGIAGAIIMWGFNVMMPSFFMLPCHCILYLYEMVSSLALRAPRAMITVGQPGVLRIVLYYFMLAVAVRMMQVYAVDRENVRSDVSGCNRFRMMIPVGLMIAAFFIITYAPHSEAEIDMLSVGQGDGLCIIAPEGEVFMVDGGSSSTDELGRYTLLPYLRYKGIDHVSYWFVTHMDADHYNGLMWLMMEGFDVDHLVLARAVEKNEAYYEMMKLCEENGTKVLYMKKGDRCGTQSLYFTCLFPDYPSGFSGTNENSLCMRLDYGDFNMIFTGDMGAEQEAAVSFGDLYGREGAVDIEVLKAAHHGSKNSNSEEWLDCLSPELCIISAGRHNLYHHPSPDTLRRLDERGIPYLCTIDCGEIRILPEPDGRFRVQTLVATPRRLPKPAKASCKVAGEQKSFRLH